MGIIGATLDNWGGYGHAFNRGGAGFAGGNFGHMGAFAGGHVGGFGGGRLGGGGGHFTR